jgi:ADP-heptose:LPS heptosyltransferase
MALPAFADLRQHLPEAVIDVAARPSIAPLAMVPAVNGRHARESDRRADRLRRAQ